MLVLSYHTFTAIQLIFYFYYTYLTHETRSTKDERCYFGDDQRLQARSSNGYGDRQIGHQNRLQKRLCELRQKDSTSGKDRWRRRYTDLQGDGGSGDRRG